MHINTLKGPSKLHGFPGASVVKNLPVNVRNAEDVGLIPGSREGNGNPLHYSYLENPIDIGVLHFMGYKKVGGDLATEHA